jgi:hypothetical protein
MLRPRIGLRLPSRRRVIVGSLLIRSLACDRCY